MIVSILIFLFVLFVPSSSLIGQFLRPQAQWSSHGFFGAPDLHPSSGSLYVTLNHNTFQKPTVVFPRLNNDESTSNTPNPMKPATGAAAPPLPWQTSILKTRELVYMPMLTQQLEMIKNMGMEEVSIDEKFVYQSSTVKPARIGNMCFRNEKFRCVRLTYFDAGESVQVFNALWYPSLEYDIPLLGIDLISLTRNRVLSVIDFQPLHPTAEYANKYISPLSSIRAKYTDLQGVLSGKIYDDTSFFSKNMLFGRFTDESKLQSVVKPAHNEYLQSYIQLMNNAVPDHSPEAKETVFARQRAYDIYSAEKDPAVGLFDAYFGKEWSRDFVHDFLFQQSVHPKRGGEEVSPAHNFKINQESGVVGVSKRQTT